MNKKMTYEYDHATGEEIVREATAEELQNFEIAAKEKTERLEKQAEQEAARLSALAKLAKLGLSEAEIAAL